MTVNTVYTVCLFVKKAHGGKIVMGDIVKGVLTGGILAGGGGYCPVTYGRCINHGLPISALSRARPYTGRGMVLQKGFN